MNRHCQPFCIAMNILYSKHIFVMSYFSFFLCCSNCQNSIVLSMAFVTMSLLVFPCCLWLTIKYTCACKRKKKLLSSWWKQGGRKNVNRPLANRKKERIAHLPVRITARRERDKKRDTHPKQIKVSWVIIFLFFSNRWGSDFKATKINCFQLISQHYSQTKTPKFAFRLFFSSSSTCTYIYIFPWWISRVWREYESC